MGNRRDFFKNLIGLLGVGALLRASEALAKKLALSIDKVPQLKKIGGSVVVALKGKQVLFIRDGENSIKALSPICTHEKCVVSYNAKLKKIECGCHKSRFDLTGKPLGGPALRPLDSYVAKLDGTRIIIDLK